MVPGDKTLDQRPRSEYFALEKIHHAVGKTDVSTAEVILEKKELPLWECLIIRNLKTGKRHVFDPRLIKWTHSFLTTGGIFAQMWKTDSCEVILNACPSQCKPLRVLLEENATQTWRLFSVFTLSQCKHSVVALIFTTTKGAEAGQQAHHWAGPRSTGGPGWCFRQPPGSKRTKRRKWGWGCSKESHLPQRQVWPWLLGGDV